MRIRTHKYAEHAYPLIKGIQGNEIEGKYRTLALNLPTMIMQSGLAQTVGFLMAKNNPEHITILEHLAKLLNTDSYQNLHKQILKSDVTQYQLLTRQAIEASSWLKRYTQALLSKETSKNDKSTGETS